MPLTVGGLRFVDPVLTGEVNSPIQDDRNYIGLELVRDLGVVVDGQRSTGQLVIKSGRQYMGQPGLAGVQRAVGMPYAQVHRDDPTELTYATPEYSWSDFIDTNLIEVSQAPGDLPSEAAEVCRRAALDQYESLCAALIFNAASGWLTSTLALLAGGSGIQIGLAGAREFKDFHIACELARAGAMGDRPDYAIVGHACAAELATAVDLQTWVGNDSNRILFNHEEVKSMLQDKLNLQKVYIASARQETAVPGAAAAMADVFGDGIFFGYGGRSRPRLLTNGVFARQMSLLPVLRRPRGARGGLSMGGDMIGAYRWSTDNPPGVSVAAAIFGSIQTAVAAGGTPPGYYLSDCVA